MKTVRRIRLSFCDRSFSSFVFPHFRNSRFTFGKTKKTVDESFVNFVDLSMKRRFGTISHRVEWIKKVLFVIMKKLKMKKINRVFFASSSIDFIVFESLWNNKFVSTLVMFLRFSIEIMMERSIFMNF